METRPSCGYGELRIKRQHNKLCYAIPLNVSDKIKNTS